MRRPYRLLTCLLLCLLQRSAGAWQSNADFITALPFTNYTTAQGLIHNRCDVVRQDDKGYLWFGTDMGICRYDGREFRHYPAPGIRPFRAAWCAVAWKGAVCFGVSEWGVAICNGDSVRFLPLKSGRLQSIGGIAVLNDSAFVLKENLRGAILLRSGVVRPLRLGRPADFFLEPCKDSRGNLWWLGNSGLLFFPGADLSRPQSIPFFEGSYLYHLQESADGGIYVSSSKGLYHYDSFGARQPARDTPQFVLPPIRSAYTSLQDAGSKLWLTTSAHGLFRLDKHSGRLDSFGTESGLISRTLWDIFKDTEGDFWIASDDGVSKLSRQDYAAASFRHAGYANITSGIVWDDTTFLFSNGEHIYSATPAGIIIVPGYANLPMYLSERIMKADAHTLWINTNEQYYIGDGRTYTYVYRFDGARLAFQKKLVAAGAAPRVVFPAGSICSRTGAFWLSSTSGLMLYRDHKFYPLPVPGGAPDTPAPTAIAEGPAGDLWVIDRARALVHYKVSPGVDAEHPYGLQQTARYDSLAAGDNLTILYADRHNRLWISTGSNGLRVAQLDAAGNIKALLRPAFSTFSSRRITSFAEDAAGDIWIGTAAGLDRIHAGSFGWQVDKGLYASELSGRYIYFVKSLGNRLYAGTSGGLGIIELRGADAAPAPPPVYITGLRVNDEQRNALLGNAGHQFGAGENNLSFSFTALSFNDEHAIRYRYKLDGLDDHWSAATPAYTISYPHLPPGHYTLQVVAGTENVAWSGFPAVYSFGVLRPFYSSAWFYLLLLLVICAALYALYRYRLAQVLALQQVRQRISKDLHDDIGATVSSIGILATMAGTPELPSARRGQFLESIAEESRYVTQALSDIVWAVNPRNDSLSAIFARLQRYASELFEAKEIRYIITVPDVAGGSASLGMQSRQHLLLIFKEAVNNLVKYSGATEATVRFTTDGRALSMLVADNGRGFDPDAAHEGNGLHNMRKRAAEMRANLSIKSDAGGTVVELEVPL